MKVCVSPVSGDYFPSQLGLLAQLCKAGYRPDLLLGSSGGNIANYALISSDFTSEGIQRIAYMMNSSLFISNWWAPAFQFLPSWILGYYHGSIYNAGSGVDCLYNELYNTKTVSTVEVWTGTNNVSKQKSQFFCNLSKNKSILCPEYFDPLNYASLPLKYCDSIVENIGAVSLASASIPGIVPPVLYEEEYYVDGGISYGSPLTPLASTIVNSNKDKNLSFVYLTPYDIDNINQKCLSHYEDLFDVNVTTLKGMSKSLSIQDRLNGVQLVTKHKNHRFIKTKCNIHTLRHLLHIADKSKISFLELYLKKQDNIDLYSFTGQDVVDQMINTEKEYYARLYWVPNDEC